jgi:hypothetical protein
VFFCSFSCTGVSCVAVVPLPDVVVVVEDDDAVVVVAVDVVFFADADEEPFVEPFVVDVVLPLADAPFMVCGDVAFGPFATVVVVDFGPCVVALFPPWTFGAPPWTFGAGDVFGPLMCVVPDALTGCVFGPPPRPWAARAGLIATTNAEATIPIVKRSGIFMTPLLCPRHASPPKGQAACPYERRLQNSQPSVAQRVRHGRTAEPAGSE